MTAAETAKEVRLASRPEGTPTLDNFAVAEVEVPKPDAGHILVRNTWLSVDPYMRGRMSAARSYVAPFEVGKVMDGGAIGEVVESNADGVAVGDVVLHGLGWRTHAVLNPSRVRVLDPEAAPVQAHLSVLGMPGLTAYAGLFDVAGMREGDTVFVSGAAGAVGSIVGQLARLRGAGRVIGSAGSAEKVRWLRDDLGFDVAFNYKDGPVRDQLREAAPGGVDVYFDNVGGDHLEAAISALNVHGRIAVCGMISQYNATEPAPAPRNLAQIIAKRFTMRGFLVGDHEHLRQEFLDEVGPLVRDGRIAYTETVVRGIERAPHAFLDLLSGGNTGKMLVRL
ncbi:NADP-dependent oxidoreductase [Saccharomonospora xinjiangensis]|uniref:NADP-dependent oxidoreductase n=1 Tax=Saccharomonospora xinjiangensis TaxID=75294 RepID=UPI00106F8BED|nr:NADP-dependent oxidoreductase [Saccharomonospora xinjiangensis]QBQ58672.1 Putative NADP-dependent oxidoreductase YfmJ [Saccharomonospora xinjiangensis]